MIRTSVSVECELGLHARAAARLVRLCSGYRSRVRIARNPGDEGIDARSILGILLLAAGRGTTLYVSVEGEDEAEVAGSVAEFFRNGFGELS